MKKETLRKEKRKTRRSDKRERERITDREKEFKERKRGRIQSK
jgi:hypothetical protein